MIKRVKCIVQLIQHMCLEVNEQEEEELAGHWGKIK